MSEKKLFNFRDKKIGNTIRTHRHNLGDGYKTLEAFVYNRATELSNIELGKNTLTIDKLITLADALEVDPMELFEEILLIYRQQEKDLDLPKDI